MNPNLRMIFLVLALVLFTVAAYLSPSLDSKLARAGLAALTLAYLV